MATTTLNDVQTAPGTRRLTTETRPATKTTELMAYIAAVLAVAITALLVGDGGDGGTDPFGAEQALRYINKANATFLQVSALPTRPSRTALTPVAIPGVSADSSTPRRLT